MDKDSKRKMKEIMRLIDTMRGSVSVREQKQLTGVKNAHVTGVMNLLGFGCCEKFKVNVIRTGN